MAYVKQAHKAPTKSFPLNKRDFMAKQTIAFKKIIEEVKNNKALIALLTTTATKATKPPTVPMAATMVAPTVPTVPLVVCDDTTLHFPHLDFHTQIIAFGDYQFTVSLPLQLSTDDGLRVFYPSVWQLYEDWQYDCFWDEIDSRESMHDY